MKKYSDAIICAIFAVIFICLYYFVPSLHTESVLYGFFILLGATIAFLSDALKNKIIKDALNAFFFNLII